MQSKVKFNVSFYCKYLCKVETGKNLTIIFLSNQKSILLIQQIITYELKAGQLFMAKKLDRFGNQEKTPSCPLRYSLPPGKWASVKLHHWTLLNIKCNCRKADLCRINNLACIQTFTAVNL